MSDENRKLATYERVANIRVHTNADSLEIISIKGWDVVSQKNIHKVGDYVVYFEVDAFLPVEERYEFLRKNSFRSTSWMGDGFRIKTIKLRGQISQGLILPLSDFPDVGSTLYEGDDLTEWLSVKKYEVPERGISLGGTALGNFPVDLIPKTDQVRFQNLRECDKEYFLDDSFEVTQKMDGSSMTVYNHVDFTGLRYQEHFGVCSRNLEFKDEEFNAFWMMARKYDLQNKLRKKNVAIQGELVGPGIQHNRWGLKEKDFYVFDIYCIAKKTYLNAVERRQICNDLGLTSVPYYGEEFQHGMPSKEYLTTGGVEFGRNVEGVVYKSFQHPYFSFKYINPEYLLKNDE